jgi:hypothetical protein
MAPCVAWRNEAAASGVKNTSAFPPPPELVVISAVWKTTGGLEDETSLTETAIETMNVVFGKAQDLDVHIVGEHVRTARVDAPDESLRERGIDDGVQPDLLRMVDGVGRPTAGREWREDPVVRWPR